MPSLRIAAPAPRRVAPASAPRPTHAFTLIELLVVIAIIAILAAILFPVFAQAREKARQTACLSNVKQIALGVQMYTQDYDECLPVAGYNAQCRGRWQWQIYPYVKNAQMFTCPNLASNPWVPNSGNYTCPNSNTVVNVGQSDRGGYGWSYALQGNSGGATGLVLDTASGYSLAAIAKPADTIIVGETGYTGTSGAAAGWALLAADPRAPYAATFGQPGLIPQHRHNVVRTVPAQGGFALPVDGRANYAFLDGHAKSLTVGQSMQIAPLVNGVPTEDGNGLVNENGTATNAYGTVANHVRPNIMYQLWNIF